MLQAASVSRTPVVSTHSCIRALCDNARNLDDEQLDALRDVGGVMQITAVPHFLRAGRKPEAVTVGGLRRPRRLRGASGSASTHVGISSDFDGGGGFIGWHNAGESAEPHHRTAAARLRRGRDRRTVGRQLPARAAVA